MHIETKKQYRETTERGSRDEIESGIHRPDEGDSGSPREWADTSIEWGRPERGR